jgi:hypothetical protein
MDVMETRLDIVHCN